VVSFFIRVQIEVHTAAYINHEPKKELVIAQTEALSAAPLLKSNLSQISQLSKIIFRATNSALLAAR